MTHDTHTHTPSFSLCHTLAKAVKSGLTHALSSSSELILTLIIDGLCARVFNSRSIPCKMHECIDFKIYDCSQVEVSLQVVIVGDFVFKTLFQTS